MTLPPFNPSATCPKCGGEDVLAQSFGRREGNEPRPLYLLTDDEATLRRCTRCGYAWPEVPLDAKEGT